jgi:hypothetical protein
MLTTPQDVQPPNKLKSLNCHQENLKSHEFNIIKYLIFTGDSGGTVVKVLRYKSEGRGSIPDGVIGIFHCHNPSDRTIALGSTQPLTEMSTRSIS